MSSKSGNAWMGSSVPGGVIEPRGPWHYDGEIDLGYGGALRMAATIVTKDPTFGWIAYGGAAKETATTMAVNPRDGVRRRLNVLIQDPSLPFRESLSRLKIELERDGFDANGDIVVDKSLKSISFAVENRTSRPHSTTIKLALPANIRYALTVDGKFVELKRVDDPDYPWRAVVSVNGPTAQVALKK